MGYRRGKRRGFSKRKRGYRSSGRKAYRGGTKL